FFQACATLRGRNAHVPGPPTVTSSPILKVISPASTQATSSLSRWRCKRLLVPAGTVSSNSMMLPLVSWPTSFKAAKRPGAAMSRCFPPPAGTTRPRSAFMLMSFPLALLREYGGYSRYVSASPDLAQPLVDETPAVALGVERLVGSCARAVV